ncbi:MAG: cation diffusion facilitator family transporter, partial [Actinomycetaceae bacterium]
HEHEHEHEHGTGLWGRLRHALTPHSHDHTESIQSAEESSAEGIRAAVFSLAGMAVTALLQIVIVWLSGSIGLLADTVHNLGHLATTIPLIVAFRIGRRPASARYPHGFRRAEDLVGLLIGLVVALSAGIIVWESIDALRGSHVLTHHGWVLAAALVGAAGNEVVARYRIRVGRRIGSAALVAEGQHARVDALTSLAVVGGVVGSWLGWPYLDPIVGLFIAVVVISVLVSSMRTVIHRLMDGVDDLTLFRIEDAASRVEGIVGVGAVRARWSGHRLLAELEIVVDAGATAMAAAETARRVQGELGATVPHLEHATVQVVSAPVPTA